MRRKTRLWVSLLPLLACLLAVRAPASTHRSQSHSPNRNRVQRPARSGGVRLDGDHHHEETPQVLVPREQGRDGHGDGADGLTAACPEMGTPASWSCTDSARLVFKRKPAFHLTPPGRAPPVRHS